MERSRSFDASTLQRYEPKEFSALLERVEKRGSVYVPGRSMSPASTSPNEKNDAGQKECVKRNIERVRQIIRHFEKSIGRLKYVYYCDGFFKPTPTHERAGTYDRPQMKLVPVASTRKFVDPEFIPGSNHQLDVDTVRSETRQGPASSFTPIAVFLRPDVSDSNGEQYVAVTLGLSRYRMNVPEPLDSRADEFDSAELFFYLPRTWQFPTRIPLTSAGSLSSAAHRMDKTGLSFMLPFAVLVSLVRYTVDGSRWLWKTHSVPNLWSRSRTVETVEPYATDTALCGCVVLDPVFEEEGFHTIHRTSTQLFMLCLITKQELAWKELEGIGALFSVMGSKQLQPVVDMHRDSLITDEDLEDSRRRREEDMKPWERSTV